MTNTQYWDSNGNWIYQGDLELYPHWEAVSSESDEQSESNLEDNSDILSDVKDGSTAIFSNIDGSATGSLGNQTDFSENEDTEKQAE